MVEDLFDPLLEGIVTDRDLYWGVLAAAKNPDLVTIWEIMTPVSVSCEPGSTLEDCEQLKRQNQVRRIPVGDQRGRCGGIISLVDVALYASSSQGGEILKEISRPLKPEYNFHWEQDHSYCGQLHEQDEILLLNRRRELRREVEVIR